MTAAAPAALRQIDLVIQIKLPASRGVFVSSLAMRPRLSLRQIRQLQQVVLEQNFGHAPAVGLGARTGLQLPDSIPPRQETAHNWRDWLLLQARLRWRRRCFFPARECRAELIDFSAALGRWLVLLSGLDVSAKYNIIAIEKAFAALEIRLETGVLGYRAEFAPLFCYYAQQQLACLDQPALMRIAECVEYLLVGDGNMMRSLLWRNESRRNGFGLFEDLLRHMSAADYALLMREHKMLDETAPALLAWLRDEAKLQKDRCDA